MLRLHVISSKRKGEGTIGRVQIIITNKVQNRVKSARVFTFAKSDR